MGLLLLSRVPFSGCLTGNSKGESTVLGDPPTKPIGGKRFAQGKVALGKCLGDPPKNKPIGGQRFAQVGFAFGKKSSSAAKVVLRSICFGQASQMKLGQVYQPRANVPNRRPTQHTEDLRSRAPIVGDRHHVTHPAIPAVQHGNQLIGSCAWGRFTEIARGLHQNCGTPTLAGLLLVCL